jgi:hypothetical protein
MKSHNLQNLKILFFAVHGINTINQNRIVSLSSRFKENFKFADIIFRQSPQTWQIQHGFYPVRYMTR